jgi:uncharacterized protein
MGLMPEPLPVSPAQESPQPPAPRHWFARLGDNGVRALWFSAGVLAILLAIIGAFVPLLPTVPFLLLAAWCFSRSCRRCERWMLNHPRFGPPLRDWREHHAVSLFVKRFATAMMAISSLGAWWVLESPWRWLPASACAIVAAWLWSLPTRVVTPGATETPPSPASGRGSG